MKTQTIEARQVMTRKLTTARPHTQVVSVIEQLVAQGVSGIPIVDERRQLLGRFTERSGIRALDLVSAEPDSRIRQQLRDVTAEQIVQRHRFTLSDQLTVFDAIQKLLSWRVSGAPVVTSDGEVLGVFSEESAMHVFIGLCWEQLPSAQVTAWLDRHDDRRIDLQTTLDQILQRFQERPYRRLVVLQNNRYVGQITRREALRAALHISHGPLAASLDSSGSIALGLRSAVKRWMDSDLQTVCADDNVLKIARLFLQSGQRQLPVVKGNLLEGQISRSDLLRAVQEAFSDTEQQRRTAMPLYLSSVSDRCPTLLT